MADTSINKHELKLAKACLAAAHRALFDVRLNPLTWLAMVHRQHHPNSSIGKIAGLLAALNCRYSDVHIRSLSAPLLLSEADTRDALATLHRAGLLMIHQTMRTGALELTLRTPESAADPENTPAGKHVV